MRWLKRRVVTNRIRWVIDNLLPPIVSDARWFNRILARAMFGNRPFDLDFKEKALSMTDEQLVACACRWGDYEPYRESDTTEAQMRFVTDSVVGPRVLEVRRTPPRPRHGSRASRPGSRPVAAVRRAVRPPR